MNEKGILLKNIYALMTDPSKDTLYGVDMLIKNGKVVKVGNGLQAEEGFRVIDGSNLAVVPGFVNTHHHFYQTLTRNLPEVQNAKLFDWLVYLYEVWKYIDEEAVYYSSLLAMTELNKHTIESYRCFSIVFTLPYPCIQKCKMCNRCLCLHIPIRR